MSEERKRKKKNVLMVILLTMSGLCLVSGLLIAAILFPVLVQAREKARQTECLSNLKQLGLGIAMYSDDWDTYFPLADRWCNCIQPYVKALHRCPSVPEGKFGYAMNSQLSQQSYEEIGQLEQTLLLYDSTNLELNAHDAVQSLPDPPRHAGKVNNAAYADGSARPIQKNTP